MIRTEIVLTHPLLEESSDSPLNGVRVWRAQLGSCSPILVEELRELLDSEEIARADRFKFLRDQTNYIATRGLLRSLLGSLLNEDPAKLVFEYGAHGKPSLNSQHYSLRFNVSHSDGWAVFATSSGQEVGIDLESIDRLKRSEDNLMQLAARILSPDELTIWQGLPDPISRTNAFLRAWTRKEAYAKATGRGIFDELSSVNVALDAAAPVASLRLRQGSSREGEPATEWILYDLSAPDGFAAALAVAV